MHAYPKSSYRGSSRARYNGAKLLDCRPTEWAVSGPVPHIASGRPDPGATDPGSTRETEAAESTDGESRLRWLNLFMLFSSAKGKRQVGGGPGAVMRIPKASAWSGRWDARGGRATEAPRLAMPASETEFFFE